MANKDDLERFSVELEKRFEEFSVWAIANRPDKSYPLFRTDFDAAHKEILALIHGHPGMGDRNAATPEPSENGPQYVNVSPAPWP